MTTKLHTFKNKNDYYGKECKNKYIFKTFIGFSKMDNYKCPKLKTLLDF
jgi:hypothetical protein